jgi:hypothetical protein
MAFSGLVLSFTLLGASLDGAAMLPPAHPSMQTDAAASGYSWSPAEQGAGPDLIGGLVGAAAVGLCGGVLWFFDPVNAAKSSCRRPRPVRARRHVGMPRGTGVTSRTSAR